MSAAIDTLTKRTRPISGAYPDKSRTLGQVTRDSFFQYTATFTWVAGTENFQSAIAIQSDSHFICVATEYSNSLQVGASGGLVIRSGGATVQLTDGASQRQLSSAQVPVDTLFGTAQRPFVWPFTHLFRGNGTIGISITGIGAPMAAGVIILVFSGFKIPIGTVPELGL